MDRWARLARLERIAARRMSAAATHPDAAGGGRGQGTRKDGSMIKATPLAGASKITWGHVSVAHIIAGLVAGGTVFVDAHVSSFTLTDPQTYTLGAIAVASFLTALGGRWAQIAQEIRQGAAALADAGDQPDADS